MATDRPGAALLREWMDRTHAKQAQVAKATGKSDAAVYGWLEGRYRPEAEARQKLERFTGGDVPASSWLTEAERAELDAVQPFAAHGGA